jgi:hypothetical protein
VGGSPRLRRTSDAPHLPVSLAGRLFGKADRVVDPVFGAMTRDATTAAWSGEMEWHHDPFPFAVTVHRADGPPTDADRRVVLELGARLDALSVPIGDALFALWPVACAAAEVPSTRFATGAAVLAALRLQGLVVHPDGRLELLYGFNDGDERPDGVFVVEVKGDHVVALEYIE